jgi:hypothetical protein
MFFLLLAFSDGVPAHLHLFHPIQNQMLTATATNDLLIFSSQQPVATFNRMDFNQSMEFIINKLKISSKCECDCYYGDRMISTGSKPIERL